VIYHTPPEGAGQTLKKQNLNFYYLVSITAKPNYNQCSTMIFFTT